MKKLVYVMMALIAIGFASCDTTAGDKNKPEQDSVITNVDSVKVDPIAEEADKVAAEPTDAPAEEPAPVESAETEEKK